MSERGLPQKTEGCKKTETRVKPRYPVNHQRKSVELLKEWEKKADMKKFEKEFQKQKAKFEKTVKRISISCKKTESKER